MSVLIAVARWARRGAVELQSYDERRTDMGVTVSNTAELATWWSTITATVLTSMWLLSPARRRRRAGRNARNAMMLCAQSCRCVPLPRDGSEGIDIGLPEQTQPIYEVEV